jgi:outer membrane protein W
MDMKRIIAVCLVIAGFAVGSSVAGASDASWIVRGSYVVTWPSTDSYQTESVIGDNPLLNELSLDSGQGFGFDLEYKMNPKLGLALMAIFTDLEGTFVAGIEPGEQSDRVSDNNTVDTYTVNFGANYHFTPESRVDFYLGAFVGWWSYDSIKFQLPVLDEEVKIDFDDQFSYGLNAGIDVPFGADSSWLFTAALKYLVSDLKESGGPREIAIDPLIASIGIGYRF